MPYSVTSLRAAVVWPVEEGHTRAVEAHSEGDQGSKPGDCLSLTPGHSVTLSDYKIRHAGTRADPLMRPQSAGSSKEWTSFSAFRSRGEWECFLHDIVGIRITIYFNKIHKIK